MRSWSMPRRPGVLPACCIPRSGSLPRFHLTPSFNNHRETKMDVVLNLLFSSPIGLLSLFTILFIIGMAIALMVWYKRKMNSPEE
jgi:hypothetical protein